MRVHDLKKYFIEELLTDIYGKASSINQADFLAKGDKLTECVRKTLIQWDQFISINAHFFDFFR